MTKRIWIRTPRGRFLPLIPRPGGHKDEKGVILPPQKPIEVGPIDSTENVGLPWGVQSVESDGTSEAGGQVLQTDADGGSLWGGIPSGGGSTLDDVFAATGPDAFWEWNESSGNTAFDSSGNGYDLIVSTASAPTWGQTAGPPGQPTAEFLNTAASQPDQMIRSLTTPNWPAGGDFSVFGWAKFDGSTTGQFMIVGQGASLTQNGTAGWSVGFSSNLSGSAPNYVRKVEIWCDNGTPPTPTIRGDNNLTADTWYWIGFVRSGGVFTMYVNNLAQSTTSSEACVAASTKIQFGYSDAIPGTSFYNGNVSYWGVWAKALSAAERTRLYEFALAAGAAPAEYVLTSVGDSTTEWDLIEDANVDSAAAIQVSKLLGDTSKALGSVAGVPTWLTLAGDVSGALTALAIGAKKVLSTMIGSGAATSSKFLRADGSGGASWETVVITDADLSTSDITTNNVTTAKHGFTPKAPNDTAKFLRGDASWAAPASLPSGSAVVATDAIWDAKGDLAGGTGADAAAALTVGANDKVLTAASGQTTGLKWAYPPGYQLDYVERTTDLTVTPTTDATAAAWISGNAVSYDGSTRVKIEVFVLAMEISSAQFVMINLYDGSTDLGRMAFLQSPTTTSGNLAHAIYTARFITPTNASHSYNIKAWKSAGTATIYSRAGGTATYMPSYMRITVA